MDTCFVIMPIGDLEFDGNKISSADFKKRYDDLIKEAVLKARPNLDVVRSDDISLPGTITSDILTRIMHSDFVIADVSFPNPNVFYELGLRHACRPGTIIIKDKNGPKVPFDIAHLRHIEYENSPSGLKALAQDLQAYFDHFEKDPGRPDNHLLELAKLTGYEFQSYGKKEESEQDIKTEAMLSVMQNPEIMEIMMRKSSGETVDEKEMLTAIFKNPDTATTLIKAMVKTGDLSFSGKPQNRPVPQFGKSKKKRRR